MAISIAKLAIHLATDTSQMVAGFSRAKALTQGFSSSLGGGLGLSAGSTGMLAMAGGAAAVAAAIGAVVYQGVKFQAMMQQAQASLAGFTGSASTAKAMLNDLFQFAATTPFQVPEIVAAARTMMAMGAETEDVMAQMQMLGQVAAGSGQPINELANVFGQVMQAGRLTGNELRQFNERGIPLLTQLSKNLGKTKAEIRELVEAGEITSTDVVQAFADMSSGSGIFAGQMEKQSQTLIGQWTTFKDNLMALAGDIVSVLIPALTQLLKTFNDIIESIRGTTRVTEEQSKASIDAYLERTKAAQQTADAEKKLKDEAAEAAKAAQKHLDDMKRKADSLTQSLRTPGEVWRDSMSEINELMQKGLIDWDTYTRAIEQATQKLEEQSEAKAGLDRASSNPALLQGTQAFITATRGGQSEFEKMHAEQQKQTAIHKHAELQRQEMITAIKDNRPAKLIPVNL